MEYFTFIMELIDAIRECMEERRREDEIVDGLLNPGFVEKLMIRISIRRSGIRGRRNRQLAFDGAINRLQLSTKPEMIRFVRVAATGNRKRRTQLARDIAESMPQAS